MYTHKNKQAICNQPLTGLVTSLFSLSFCSHILFSFSPLQSSLFFSLSAWLHLVSSCSLCLVSTLSVPLTSQSLSLSLVSHQLCSSSAPSLIQKCNLWFLQLDLLVQLQTDSCLFRLTYPQAVCNIIIFYSDCFCHQFTHCSSLSFMVTMMMSYIQ